MPQTDATSNPSNQITRYVEHPARRRAVRTGRRNLAWGVAFLIAALSILGIALFVGGARAILPLALFLACFTALWVLARIKVFAQRNGVFFALSVIALLGASAALLEQAWYYLASHPISTLAGPNVTLGSANSTGGVASHEIPLLTESLKYEQPEPSLARVRASKDATVNIGGKTYAIRKGDIFQLSDEKSGEYVIVAGEFLARVPVDSMDQLTPETARRAEAKGSGDDGKGALEKAAASKITKRAQAEAARRFPALAQAGTSENKTFVEAYNDLKRRNSDVLEDPEWPVHLAEILAQRFGWQEVGAVDPDAPSVVEPSIAPGTKVLSESDEPLIPAPAPAPAQVPVKKAQPQPADNALPKGDSDIPPPPRGPLPE